MDDSDSSALSSAPPSEDEKFKLAPIFLKAKIKTKEPGQKPAKKVSKKPKQLEPPPSPPRPPRSPSPPHDDTLADNPDIAFLVMFRSRFSAAFPPKLAHLGPQDIERGVDGPAASPLVEGFLCALLGIVLNRKKPPEQGHYGRALEEALASQRSQWPRSWNGQNPLAGSRTFHTMSPNERLNLLRTLVLWSLSSSEVISQSIKDSYKQSRHEDDLNQPLSVQPWGIDGDKRRYWLVEGQDDTSFRLYRENAKSQKDIIWWSMAGSIDELKAIAETLDVKDTTQAARRLSSKIISAIPRFEATEEKRRRRDYRQMRRAQFARPEPGFSLYEGRTRGKRMRYTFDDDEFEESDFSIRRSGRQSDRSTPAEARGPVVTASGRHVRTREGGVYGESLLSGQSTAADTPLSNDFEGSEISGTNGMSNRASRHTARGLGSREQRKRKFNEIHNGEEQMSDEDDAASSGGWNSADNEYEAEHDDSGDEHDDDDEDEESDGNNYHDDSGSGEPSSLVVKLKVPKASSSILGQSLNSNGTRAELAGDTIDHSTTTDSASKADLLRGEALNLAVGQPRGVAGSGGTSSGTKLASVLSNNTDTVRDQGNGNGNNEKKEHVSTEVKAAEAKPKLMADSSRGLAEPPHPSAHPLIPVDG